MATPGALVRVLAGALGVPKATVAQHDRNLLVAGLRSKRGRGWAAPSVTPRDVAHLVTAALGSAQVKESAATVRRYNATRVNHASMVGVFAKIGIDELAALPSGHSFVDALEALFIAASTGSLEKKLADRASKAGTDKLDVAPAMVVEALAPGTQARISMRDGEVMEIVTYGRLQHGQGARLDGKRPFKRQAKLGKHRRVDGDLEEYRRISEMTILRAADLLIPSKEKY
jgi:hypothetical protein